MAVKKAQVRKLVGKTVYAMKKDGTVVSGKLVGIRGSRVLIEQPKGKAHVKAILPLVLFDLLAIGTGPYGYGYNPFYGPGPFYGGYGYPGGFFW